MKHARQDYSRIQDPEHKIPENEPVFLLRGQDISAPLAVEFWVGLNDAAGGDPELSRLALEQVDAMRTWQKKNGMKPADGPKKTA